MYRKRRASKKKLLHQGNGGRGLLPARVSEIDKSVSGRRTYHKLVERKTFNADMQHIEWEGDEEEEARL